MSRLFVFQYLRHSCTNDENGVYLCNQEILRTVIVKNAIVLLLALMVAGQAYGSATFGLRLGLISANATHGPSNNYESDPKSGVIVGGALEASLNKKGNRTIRLEFAYVQKGWQESVEILGLGVSGKAEVDELVFTPAVVFRLSDSKTVPYILFGMDLGLTLKSEATVQAGGFYATGDIPDWESTNVGLDLGAGLLFPSGEGEFLTELRFNIGMTDMHPSEEWDVMTNGVQFIVGYNFEVPKAR